MDCLDTIQRFFYDYMRDRNNRHSFLVQGVFLSDTLTLANQLYKPCRCHSFYILGRA